MAGEIESLAEEAGRGQKILEDLANPAVFREILGKSYEELVDVMELTKLLQLMRTSITKTSRITRKFHIFK